MNFGRRKNNLFYQILPLLALLLLLGTWKLTNQGSNEMFPMEVQAKFTQLASARTNFCAGPSFIYSKADTESMQGSCCNPMDLHRYSEQLQGLKSYQNISLIPTDPYDISVTLAKKLLDYQKTIILTTDQQTIYKQATQMSMEKGPCCCKCWRWDAFEGLGKYLITERSFTAEQVAKVWDLADGCGGKGHQH